VSQEVSDKSKISRRNTRVLAKFAACIQDLGTTQALRYYPLALYSSLLASQYLFKSFSQNSQVASRSIVPHKDSTPSMAAGKPDGAVKLSFRLHADDVVAISRGTVSHR